MKTAVFSTKRYDREELGRAAADAGLELTWLEPRLDETVAPLADGHEAVCCFVNDDLSAPVLERLAQGGVRYVALRSAGYNHVDLAAAARLGLRVARVPAYSPYAVAEHCCMLLLALNRHVHKAYSRVREGNFALNGLLGFDVHGKTIGIVGTGTIGTVFARIMTGFGVRILASDPSPNDEAEELGVTYVDLDTLLRESDVVSLFTPLLRETHHLIDADAVEKMRDGVMLLNTSRGALVDTEAVIAGLKSGKVGAVGLDVYEEEGPLFFEDRSDTVIPDDVFARLLTFPNVIITGHQAFFTREALVHIASTTVENLLGFANGGEIAEVAA